MTQDLPDPHQLLGALAIENITAVQRIGDGWGDTILWRVEHAGHVSALRIYPANQRNDRDREVEILRAELGIPIPRLEAVGDPFGIPAMLISWCPGKTIYEALWQAPERADQLGAAMGRIQARLHCTPVPDSLRSTLSDDWIGWAGVKEGTFAQQLRHFESNDQSVIHLDLHPQNVIVEGDSISCVIDWTNALIGDPRADIARTYSILTWVPIEPNVDTQRVRKIRTEFRRGWLRAYQEEITGELENFAPFLAWAARAMLNDLVRKVGQPRVWLTESDLARMRRRERRWSRIAAIQPDSQKPGGETSR